MARPSRFPFPHPRLAAALVGLPLALSQGACQMANHQMGRLLQIPRSVLRVEAAPAGAPEAASPARPGEAAAGGAGPAPAALPGEAAAGRVPAA